MTQQTPIHDRPTPLAVPWTPPAPAPQAMPAPQGYQAPAPSQPYAPQGQAQPSPQQPYAPQDQEAHIPHQVTQQLYPPQTSRPDLYRGQGQPAESYPPLAQGQYQPQSSAAPGYPPHPQMVPPPEPPKSKSLLGKLIRRKSKEASSEAPMAMTSRSLIDKNFFIGLAAGLMLGFLVLPMIFGGSDDPAYAPMADNAAAPDTDFVIVEGESFVDAALAEDMP